MEGYEKTGAFYLGKEVNPKDGALLKKPLLYDSKNLTTHAICVGMTGSGKTGLGIDLLEEASLSKIPSIVIDPKGDLGNLLLTFPKLSPEDFQPWLDQAEAERNGMTLAEYSKKVATTWKDGLKQWAESPERIQAFRDSVEIGIYTPASNAGIPLSILNSFDAPSKELIDDPTAFRERVMSTTSSLLGLIGIEADPLNSPEHILISSIFDQAWQKEKNLDLPSLIQEVQKPPFSKIGVMDIDTFFPKKDRTSLSIKLNGLLASPGFQAWMQGKPLDIQSLLYTDKDKPKLSIISIAHLSDAERMFFVTLLLNEFISWMRRQPGTSNLRAVLYMDEIFGYFPPIKSPPSKIPMLTLLKQARAYGIGIVLATQNPVDLDYKGLANCGTWFIGKLQTERDKSRILEGLQIASNGEIDTKQLNSMMSLIGKRIFLLRSIHEKNPLLFQTRWTMSYLGGPMTLSQISRLMKKEKTEIESPRNSGSESLVRNQVSKAHSANKPIIPSSVPEFFLHSPYLEGEVYYSPRILGTGKLHFVDSKNKVDTWQNFNILAAVDSDGNDVDWSKAINDPDAKDLLEKTPLPESTFEELPSALMQEKTYTSLKTALATYLYQNQTLNLYRSRELNLISTSGENEEEFRTRLLSAINEKRDALKAKIEDKYGAKVRSLEEKIRKARDKIAQKQEKASEKKTSTLISIGTTILGAVFGRKVTKGTISQAGTSLRKVGQISQDNRGVEQAETDCKSYEQQLSDLRLQMQNETNQLFENGGSTLNSIEKIVIRPRKSDIDIGMIALVWWPQSTSKT